MKKIDLRKTQKTNQKGITLIALVITIIVLLILAGVAISQITGNDNILSKAQNASDETKKAEELSQIQISAVSAVAQGNNTGNIDNQESINALKNGISGVVESTAGITLGGENWVVTGKTGRTYTIYKNGNVTVGGTPGADPVVPVQTAITYTIKYNGNGGTGTTADSTHTGGENKNLTANGFSRTGYTFLGWSTSESATSATYTDGQSVKDLTSEDGATVNLYAVWKQNLAIGTPVTYSTTMNGQTLNNWKVFYVDGDKTYIIYGDYLPNAAVSSFTGKQTNGTYSVYTNTNRTDLINAMSTKSNWDSLLTGTLNGTIPVNQTRTENVWAMGAPDLDLWVNSWNASYPSDRLYTKYANPVSGKTYDGWYVGNQENPSTTYIDISGKTGYNNTLYFPYKKAVDNSKCYGYWLASPSAADAGCVMNVYYNGYVRGNDYYTNYRAFRPVVCLPSNILNQ